MFYYTNKNPYMDENFYIEEHRTRWQTASEENSRIWSAAGYFFGKRIAAEKHCTVGIIGCNWGGTSASAWVSRSDLLSDDDTRSYVDEYDRAMYGKTFAEYGRELADYREWEKEWEPRIAEYYSLHPNDGNWNDAQEYAGGLSRYPEPLGPKSPFRAGGLYETMLSRVCPYPLAGFIYYQGESDDHKPHTYEKLLKMLIARWRADWNDDTLPFINVQLPVFINDGETDRHNWCFIREAQLNTFLADRNTGLAVLLDKGEYNNIHPLDKKTVGERLALQALHLVYGLADASAACAPVYKSMTVSGNEAVIGFYNGEGLYADGELSGFEIAGADKRYYPAKAEIRGDTVAVRSEDVSEPMYVRYFWVNYGKVTLFGGSGIPASPFRSSADDGSDVIDI